MNLHQLRLFYEVARQKSVTKAAVYLKISQPAVTAQIKQFEKDEGIHLLKARGRGIELTPLGQEMYLKSQRLFAVEAELEQLLEDAIKNKQEQLRLTGNYLTNHYLLPPLLTEFGKAEPEIEVQVATLNSHDVMASLLTDKADLAFLGNSDQVYPQLQRQMLLDDRLCFVASPNYSFGQGEVSLNSLSKQLFIGREPTSYTQQRLERLFLEAKLGPIRQAFIYNNARDGLEAAQAGQGIFFCSALMASPLIAAGTLVEIKLGEVVIPHPLYVYWRGQENQPRGVKVFQAFLKAQFN